MPQPYEKCSIGLASALFDLPDAEFVRRYIRSGLIKADKLHQLSFHDLFRHYEQTPDRQKKRAYDDWKMHQEFQ